MKSLKERLKTAWQEVVNQQPPSPAPFTPTQASIAERIDHTSLKGGVIRAEIQKLAEDGKKWGVASICVHPGFLPVIRPILEGSSTLACTVLNFPFGFQDPDAVLYELQQSKRLGAQELDIVLRYGDLRAGLYDEVYSELCRWIETAGNTPVKIILETSALTRDEIAYGSLLSQWAGAQFVKTSTGFGSRGASVEDIEIMRKATRGMVKTKASGGIQTREQALSMIAAGADRIGASATKTILGLVEEAK